MLVDGARVGRYARAAARWARLLAPWRPAPGLRISYGHDRVPGPGEAVRGSTVVFQRLASVFPNSPGDFTLLYLCSTWLPRDLRPLLWAARRRRAFVVVSQNGVGYPAWAGGRAEEINRRQRRALLAADRVLYQSEFCKVSADAFLGSPRGSWEVLPNAVDVELFTPAPSPPADGPVLLLGGDQTQGTYRVELALRTLECLLREHSGARLVVTGELPSYAEPLAAELGLAGRVEFVGRYAQRDAPALFRRAHVLLQTQMNDAACPYVVLEAMACGLPVVHPASGGTVELVADVGGIGVPHYASWDRLDPPAPEALAEAVSRVLADHDRYRHAARRRVAEHFSLSRWLARHAEIFDELLGAPRSACPATSDQ
jgi:glycosyltransferase involved in cell wall biosynthesis